MSCPWHVLSGRGVFLSLSWPGRGMGYPCHGTWLGYPFPSLPPPKPGPGQGYPLLHPLARTRTGVPEAIGYPPLSFPRWANWKHYLPSYFVRGGNFFLLQHWPVYFLLHNITIWLTKLADAGFCHRGQNVPWFWRCSKADCCEWRVMQANRGNRWALEALAFLTVKYAFSHFSWYPFNFSFKLDLWRYSTIHISIQKILVIFANAIFFYLMGEIRDLNYFDLVCRYIDLCKRWSGAYWRPVVPI